MTDREKLKLRAFMEMAVVISKLGTCPRAKVGAVIVRQGRVISSGYNGAPPGMPHCVHETFAPCDNATHAELNAVVFAARHGISTENGTVFVTLSPCVVCARLLLAAGIERVWYLEEYRDTAGKNLLNNVGVPCRGF